MTAGRLEVPPDRLAQLRLPVAHEWHQLFHAPHFCTGWHQLFHGPHPTTGWHQLFQGPQFGWHQLFQDPHF